MQASVRECASDFVTGIAQNILTWHISVQLVLVLFGWHQHTFTRSWCTSDLTSSTNSHTAVQLVLVAAVVSSFIYCLVGRRYRMNQHTCHQKHHQKLWCTSVLPSSSTNSLTQQAITVLVIVCFVIYCFLAGGIEHKFYTSIQCSFLWLLLHSMHQKRIYTSPLPQHNLSLPEINKHCIANTHTAVQLVLVVVSHRLVGRSNIISMDQKRMHTAVIYEPAMFYL